MGHLAVGGAAALVRSVRCWSRARLVLQVCHLAGKLSSPAHGWPAAHTRTHALLAPLPPQEAPLSPGQVADLIDSGDSAGGGTGRHWVLDPIDGTRGFVGMRQYAVCLGLLQDGQVRRHQAGRGVAG